MISMTVQCLIQLTNISETKCSWDTSSTIIRRVKCQSFTPVSPPLTGSSDVSDEIFGDVIPRNERWFHDEM